MLRRGCTDYGRTIPARTILDCAGILPPDEDYRLEEMCAQAIPRSESFWGSSAAQTYPSPR